MQEINFNNLPEAVSRIDSKLEHIQRLLENSSNQQEQDKIFNVKEAAKFLNLSVPTIYGKVQRMELPFMKKSKRLYFSKESLINYLKTGTHQTREEIEADADSLLVNKRRRASK